jgi:hypothetical protein
MIITTEIRSLGDDDSLVTATKTYNDATVLSYYENINDYKENEMAFQIIVTQEFLQEIIRVFACPKV